MNNDEQGMTGQELMEAYLQLIDDYAENTPHNLAQPNPNKFVHNVTTDSALVGDKPTTEFISA